MELKGRFSDLRIVQFATTEKSAIEWANTHTWQLNASTEHNIRLIVSKLQGPWKMLPFFFESEGAKLRGIRCDVHLNSSFTPWRQVLVDCITAYRRHFPTWNAANRQGVLVNFHELDPIRFPDEYVLEARAARNFRFVIQRRLFGVGMNTILAVIGDNVRAETDWEFTGEPPLVETIASPIWTNAPHTQLGYDTNSCHGYMLGPAGDDNELSSLPQSHRVGQAGFDALCDDVPFLAARFGPGGHKQPAMHPILAYERRWQVRAKDLHECLASASWRALMACDCGAGMHDANF